VFDLTGKTALVTGAASGIGEAVAHCLARAGAFVYVADLDEDNGRRVAGAIAAEASGGEGRARVGAAAFVALDVRSEADCARAEQMVREDRGRLDILVNNAGVGHVGTTLNTTGADLDRLYQVNVRGVFNVTRAFLAGMVARRSGAIVNMASIGGIVGVRDRAAYCVTKFAVVGLTKAMALDHAADGVRVNCVCPGRVETPFVTARLAEYPDPKAAYREMAATQALGRMGEPGEIAAAVLYLASDEAAFVTGSALIVDGGWSAGK
jgi:NAD(P)-dependent dehydrogenase (short-subunit alcohol dehydrogenase family)